MKKNLNICTGRAVSMLLTAVLCLLFFVQAESIKAEDDITTVNNIVLFAQFDAGGSYNFMDEKRTELIVDNLTRTDTAQSLYGYINAISYGQAQTACYFPQLENGTVQPYILSQPLENYTRESLALEIIRNADIPKDMPLDGDNDGYIDNFILVVDGSAESQQDTLWQHEASLAYTNTKINGKTADTYNIHNSSNLFGSEELYQVPFDLGVICHEFLHSLGYPDLYQGTGFNLGIPVGTIWDIMAGTLDSRLVSPLAYMRASRSGWLETADITENGTYTLYPALSDSGNRVYLLKTPLSATEFFAVEFRQKGNYGQLDGQCETGMLVYRVNTLVNGNHHLNDEINDEIYLFRPSNNVIWQANYGGEGRDNFIGSLNLSDSMEDGALTYSNGVNSGIRIDNITIDGDILTFDVQFAEIDLKNQWLSVPNDMGLDWPGTLDIAASDSGIVYLAGVKNNGRSAGLYQAAETGCTLISDMTVTGSMYEIQLAVAVETPYLLYRDADYKAVLCTYNASSGAWQTLWQSSTFAQYADITAKDNKIYICYTEGDYPSYILRTICYSDGNITDVGGIISGNACNPSLVCTGETVAVAYRDLKNNDIPKLALWKNNGWTSIVLSDKPCSRLSTASDGETMTVAVISGEAAGLYHYRDNMVTFTEYPKLMGEPFHVRPMYANGMLMAAIYTQLEFNYSLYCWNNSEWEMLGGCIEAQYVIDPRAAVSGNTVYTAYQLGIGLPDGNPVFIKSLQYGENIMGDVNADGKFNISDVVLLQKWLLAIPDTKLNNWKAADFYADNRLDVFDLCLMKKALICSTATE